MPMNPRLLRPRASNFDPDAATYMNAVAVADGQQLEPAVKQAINNFVKGCKQDGIWSALKASCILMGARTLAGALTPLVGSAPTNVGPFVAGDYDRKFGLVGNGTTKYLNTNRNANADPQDNFHMALYLSETIATSPSMGAGGAGVGSTQITTGVFRCRNENSDVPTVAMSTASLHGMSRSSSTAFVGRCGGASQTFTRDSQTPFSGNIFTHARNSGGAGIFSLMRISYYSIGQNLNLATLETRVAALGTAIGAAI